MGPAATLGVGLGLKPMHYDEALRAAADDLWFEFHAENHMVAGGPRLAWLERLRECHRVSLHGVGLSLASDAPPDAEHLARFAALVRRIEPALVSEHLAWSRMAGAAFPDLLPFPRSHAALIRIADNIDRVQQAIGRTLAIENPSHYLAIDGHEWDEPAFLSELARRTGCGLLLDLNNVHVSAANLQAHGGESIHAFALGYLDAFALGAVTEVHLAGHSRDPLLGDALLIDSHDAPVARVVWALYEELLARTGPLPTLIERDAEVPGFHELMAERAIAQELMERGVPA
ncbi:MAG: DUF692 domain-containing protein [Burkholderiales bacterium]|nr:DUF692 domain-containing protein [Burkholderiales bacterium]